MLQVTKPSERHCVVRSGQYGELMARLTIKEAIELSPYGKTYFYKKHINGKSADRITVSVDENDKKYIESSELERVFPNLASKHADKPVSSTVTVTSDLGANNHEQAIEQSMLVKELRSQIHELKEDKQFLQGQLLRLSPPEPAQVKQVNWLTRWWNAKDDD